MNPSERSKEYETTKNEEELLCLTTDNDKRVHSTAENICCILSFKEFNGCWNLSRCSVSMSQLQLHLHQHQTNLQRDFHTCPCKLFPQLRTLVELLSPSSGAVLSARLCFAPHAIRSILLPKSSNITFGIDSLL